MTYIFGHSVCQTTSARCILAALSGSVCRSFHRSAYPAITLSRLSLVIVHCSSRTHISFSSLLMKYVRTQTSVIYSKDMHNQLVTLGVNEFTLRIIAVFKIDQGFRFARYPCGEVSDTGVAAFSSITIANPKLTNNHAD